MEPKQQKTEQKDKIIFEQWRHNENNGVLDLWSCGKTWVNILKSRKWNHLKTLQLNQCNIHQYNIKQLFCHEWSNLRSLALSNNNLGVFGMNMLIRANLSLLQDIWLVECQIGNQGARSLIKSRWPILKIINITKNRLGIDADIYLSTNNWKKLQIYRGTYNQDTKLGSFHLITQPNNAELNITSQYDDLLAQLQNIYKQRQKHL